MVDPGRFRASPKEVAKWFTDLPPSRITKASPLVDDDAAFQDGVQERGVARLRGGDFLWGAEHKVHAPEAVHDQVARVAQEMLGVIQSLTATQDLLLFLPYGKKTLAEKGHSYDAAINQKLPEVVGEYFRPLTPLTGTLKKKVTDALTYIAAVEDWKAEIASVDEQPAVR